MGAVKIEIIGVDALKERLSKATGEAAAQATKQLNKGALLIRNHAVKSIKTPSPGRVYRKGKAKRKSGGSVSSVGIHIASKAGDAPNVDTGNLWRNISVVGASKGKRPFALIRSRAAYSSHLEFGTRKMDARPFMYPALKANRKKILLGIKKALDI